MKTIFLQITLLVMFLLPVSSFAQTFTCTIQNQSAVGTEFSFDIYILRTGGTEIYLSNSDFIVTFNNSNFTSPTYVLTQRGDPGSRLDNFYGSSTSIVSSNRAILNILQPSFGNQTEFDTRVQVISNSGLGTLIAKIKITGISNTSGTANIQWRSIAPNNTTVATFANTDPWAVTDISANGTYTNPPDAPLPVELSSFTASTNQSAVNLKWQTKTEVNNYGFEVERASSITSPIQGWEKIGFVAGNGNSNSPKDYSFVDKNPAGGSKFIYRLKQIDTDGKFEYSNEVEIELVPNEFNLFQNYPNPFNPVTNIKFAVPKAGNITLGVYNILGEKVRDLITEFLEPGIYNVPFDGKDLGSGTYIYRLQAEDFVQVKKMLLVR